MSKISPFAIHKTLIGIGGEPKSVKRLRSGDLLIETMSDLQTKSFLLAKTFFNSPVTVSPHKTLNSCRGVISEPDLLSTPDAEILEGFSDQGVIQTIYFLPHLLYYQQYKWPGITNTHPYYYYNYFPDNNLNTLVSPLETETRSRTPPAKLNSVSTENFTESVLMRSMVNILQRLSPTSCKSAKSKGNERKRSKYRNQISK
ncbi:RNA-directed DNA polymerase from mobile element jockey [Trichonephila clavipes]|nr:RNA-directed DNA polymerase from mobile element jockey [Trichonephila clavipes]